MASSYDSKIIYQFADILYSRAQSIIAVYTLVGAFIGGIVGWGFGKSLSLVSSSNPGLFMLLGALLLGLLGYWIGSGKAFWLKLQAQTALCQAKIEENTR